MKGTKSRLATLFAAGAVGFALLTGCTESEPVDSTTTTVSPEANSTEGADSSQEGSNMDVTQEQRDFLADLIAEPLPQDEATERIEQAGYIWRLGTIDGEPQAVTMDYRLDRLTLTVDNGLVTDGAWG